MLQKKDGEKFEFFLFGTASCQLKSIRLELINEQLSYFEPKFQASLRVNQKILDFDSIDEKYINENIMNGPLVFEENEMQNIPLEQLVETNSLLIPCVPDDAFIDKTLLFEPLSGKNFNEIYKTFLVSQKEQLDNEKEELKTKIYEKTIMRKHLLKIFFKKFKVKENIEVLKTPKQPEKRIDMDKFLCKIKGYRKKINKKIEKAKEEEEDIFGDNEVDWAEDIKIENSESNDEVKAKELERKENVEEIKIEVPNEEEITIDLNNELKKDKPEEQQIKLKKNMPKKLLKKSVKQPEKKIEVPEKTKEEPEKEVKVSEPEKVKEEPER